MSEAKTLSGSCLCGAITYTVRSKHGDVGACHCGMCRKWSGGVLFALDDASDLEMSGEENLSVYKSSDWGERCFCSTCGSNLFWRAPSLGYVGVIAGGLDDQDGLTFTSQIFVDHKVPYFAFANETKMMTEAETLAQFAPSQNQQK